MTPKEDSARRTVRAFLDALGARDLDLAATFLHPDVEMIFPGAARFTALEELVDWARPRYREIAKQVDRIDVAGSGEEVVVFVQGTLRGLWPDGRAFDGVRFADWFVLRDGKILRQHVWNDLAEARHRDLGAM